MHIHAIYMKNMHIGNKEQQSPVDPVICKFAPRAFKSSSGINLFYTFAEGRKVSSALAWKGGNYSLK
jgi:hypothetical protein